MCKKNKSNKFIIHTYLGTLIGQKMQQKMINTDILVLK